MGWAKRTSRPIPRISSPVEDLEINDYSLGMDSFVSNDKFPVKKGGSNMWRLAQNARVTTFGEYETRRGFDFHSAAAGETQDQAQTTTTGAVDMEFTQTTRYAQSFTTAAAGLLTKLELRLKDLDDGTGTIIVELWSDDTGPSDLLARSSIAGSAVTGSYAYVPAYFPDAPTLDNTTTYWIVVYVQPNSSGSYAWSSTTAASTASESVDSGVTWTPASYALNFRQHYATEGGVKGLLRAYKSDGTKVTIFAHGTSVYSVDNVTGALSTIKNGLNASATHYRFALVNDIVYYVNSFDGLRKWNFSTESQVSSTNYSHIREHKGLLFLVDVLDPTKIIYSNFGDYETFTSTDFVHVPSPKTGDPITAIESLNGYLLIWTRNNKFVLSGDDNATFHLDEAPDQKGTFSQESITADKNFAYYISDDGIYRTNGSEAQLLSEHIYQDAVTMNNKDEACIEVNRGRLYAWFASAGSGNNDTCYVWNLNFSTDSDTVESVDTNAFVARSFSAFDDSDALLAASSRVGQVFWQELDSNDYTNAGGDIDFELRTHYLVGSSPAVLKQYRRWQPRFAAQSGSYTIRCEFATDLRDNWDLAESLNVQGTGSIWGEATWGEFTWGTTAEMQAQLHAPGEYRRMAFRYKHYASRQPHKFLGHSFVTQTRRMR